MATCKVLDEAIAFIHDGRLLLQSHGSRILMRIAMQPDLVTMFSDQAAFFRESFERMAVVHFIIRQPRKPAAVPLHLPGNEESGPYQSIMGKRLLGQGEAHVVLISYFLNIFSNRLTPIVPAKRPREMSLVESSPPYLDAISPEVPNRPTMCLSFVYLRAKPPRDSIHIDRNAALNSCRRLASVPPWR